MVRNGSIASKLRCPRVVRLPSDSGHADASHAMRRRGIDLRIHPYFALTHARKMDCRVKPGNDDDGLIIKPVQPVGNSHPYQNSQAARTR